MTLEDSEMHRLGLAFVYRMVPVIIVAVLYGMSDLENRRISYAH